MVYHERITHDSTEAMLAQGLANVSRELRQQQTTHSGNVFIPDGQKSGSGVLIGSQASEFDGIAHQSEDGTLTPLVDGSGVGKQLAESKEILDQARKDIQENKQALADTQTALTQARKDIQESKDAVSAAQRTADDASQAAAKAQLTADGKNKVATSPAEPAHAGLAQGDLWRKTDANGRITGEYVWDGAEYQPHQLTASGVLVPGSVGATLIQDGSVTSPKIQAGSVDASKLAANSVTADKLAAGSVTAGKIQAASVGADKLAANSVTADKLAANSVTADKIQANSITGAKLTGDAINGKTITSGVFQTSQEGVLIRISDDDHHARAVGPDSTSSSGMISFYDGDHPTATDKHGAFIGGTYGFTGTWANSNGPGGAESDGRPYYGFLEGTAGSSLAQRVTIKRGGRTFSDIGITSQNRAFIIAKETDFNTDSLQINSKEMLGPERVIWSWRSGWTGTPGADAFREVTNQRIVLYTGLYMLYMSVRKQGSGEYAMKVEIGSGGRTMFRLPYITPGGVSGIDTYHALIPFYVSVAMEYDISLWTQKWGDVQITINDPNWALLDSMIPGGTGQPMPRGAMLIAM
ncbi:MAG: hypothetical protein ACFNZJ_05675 [Parascardovia denticolens]